MAWSHRPREPWFHLYSLNGFYDLGSCLPNVKIEPDVLTFCLSQYPRRCGLATLENAKLSTVAEVDYPMILRIDSNFPLYNVRNISCDLSRATLIWNLPCKGLRVIDGIFFKYSPLRYILIDPLIHGQHPPVDLGNCGAHNFLFSRGHDDRW